MGTLNSILHQELRLSIISFLVGIESAEFKKLLEVTKASKGNLSVQLSKLQQAGYIEIHKSFKGNYPHTNCNITKEGREAFETYLVELKKLLKI
jgi:DNA-binding transcriptional ArsR family regulator